MQFRKTPTPHTAPLVNEGGTEDTAPSSRTGVGWRQAPRSQGGSASCGPGADSPLEKPAQGQSKRSPIQAFNRKRTLSTLVTVQTINRKLRRRRLLSPLVERGNTSPQRWNGTTPRPAALAAARPSPSPSGPSTAAETPARVARMHGGVCVLTRLSGRQGPWRHPPSEDIGGEMVSDKRAPSTGSRAPGHRRAESSPCRKGRERVTRRQF